MRPGGYGLLLAGGTVDELIYSDIGNEVLLIKYVDSASAVGRVLRKNLSRGFFGPVTIKDENCQSS